MKISISQRLNIMGVVPVILLAICLVSLSWYKVNELTKAEVENTRASLFDTKKEQLKSYIQIAQAAVDPIHERGGNLDEALEVLKRLKYGDNGYFFGYDSQGVRIFQGGSNKGVGSNLWDLKDADGVYIIRDLVKVAKQGGGFVGYRYPKPGQENPELKLSYAVYYERWDLMIGTGFYLDDANQIIQAIEDKAAEELAEILVSSVSLAAILVLVGLGFALMVKRSVMLPIHDITCSMDKLAQGEADLTARLKVEGDHELAQLARGFNSFVASLQQMVMDIGRMATQVNAQSQEITEKMQRIDDALQYQQADIENSASGMNELAATAQNIAQNTSDAADSATASNNKINLAENTVQGLSQDVQQLSQDVGTSNDAISALEDNVKDIISVVGVIREIAEQTNLLALNAAIEAARAGEQGRGFAVVADEVRTLATRTQDSTVQVQESIDKLQAVSNKAIQNMQVIFERSANTVSHSANAVTELQDVTGNVDNIQALNLVIATAAQEQSSVCESLNQTIVGIADQSKTSAQIANENSSAAQQLAAAAEQLEQRLSGFKVS